MSKTENSIAIPAEKPLNQSQIKNLRELVQGDFKDLQSQVSEEIDRRLAKRLEEINARFSRTDDLEAAKQRLRESGRRAEDELRALVEELTQGDIEVRSERYANPIFSVETDPDLLVQKGRDEAEQKAKSAAGRLKSTAMRILQREQRGIERTVLLQGITSGSAQQILEDMPAREDVMTLVSGEIEIVAGDDIAALMTSESQAKGLDEG